MSRARGGVLGQHEQPTWTSFGARIRTLRHGRGWTQAQVAFECGIDASRISRFEHGQEHPSLESLAWMADAFGFHDMGEFMSGVEVTDFFAGGRVR